MADGLRQAIRSADVLGLPTRYQLNRSPRYGMVFEGIDRHHLYSSSQRFADSGLHWYLQWSGALAYLLRGRDYVGVIDCRYIGPQIADAFGLGSVRTYLVWGEPTLSTQTEQKQRRSISRMDLPAHGSDAVVHEALVTTRGSKLSHFIGTDANAVFSGTIERQ